MTTPTPAPDREAIAPAIFANIADSLAVCEREGVPAFAVMLALEEARTILALLSPVDERPFQLRVAPWMQECFGPTISADRVERGDRMLEEVLELLQSGGYERGRVAALTDYVWSRPVGEPSQEVGGVMVTLAAYCLAHDLDMHDAGETELARINQPAIVEKIRAKQAAKPTGSALPIAIPGPLADERPDALAKAVEALDWYGEQARLARLIHSEGDAGRHALAEDGGKRARSVLAAIRGGEAASAGEG